MSDVMAFDPKRTTNAQAIQDCVALGYLKDSDEVLDATYGLGRFWRIWRPEALFDNDKYVKTATLGFDYRAFPDQWGASFDVVVFDPPYKLNGTGGSHPSDEGYGVATPYRSIDEVAQELRDGFRECVRVTRPGGLVLYKTQAQVVSGEKRWLDMEMWDYARAECRLVDQLYVFGYRKQPPGRRQVHARSNVSVLQVYQRAK